MSPKSVHELDEMQEIRRRDAAERHGNLELWQQRRSNMERWWLERYTMDEIRDLAKYAPEESTR